MSNRKQKRNRFRNRQKERKQRINERRRREFLTRVAGLDPDRILYLPLDVGKNVNWMRADTGAGRVVHPPRELTTDQKGYRYWQQCLLSYLTGGQFDLLIVGHEPTGIYHESWCRHILSDFAPYLAKDAQPALLYRFINPYQCKLEREQLTLRPRKTDPIDLRAMLSLLQQGQGTPATLPLPQVALLHQHVFFERQATRKLRAARIEIQRHFDRIWPGAVVNVQRFKHAHPDLPVPTPIVRSKPLERKTLRVILEHCPNPYCVRELGVQGIISLFHRHDTRCGPVTAERILHCARNAVLSPPAVLEIYLDGLQLLLSDEAHWIQRQQQAQARLESLVLQTPARHLLSICGLSPRWAAYYLDLVDYPPRFDWADQVWSYVGFDPIQSQSGDSDPHKRHAISRRGDPFHRHIFSWMGLMTAGHHPTFGQTFLDAEVRGMGIWGAAIHTAHKLHRTCFRLLLDDRPYRDDTHPDDLTRWRAYWLAWRQHRRQPDQHPHPGSWRPTR
jgi:transposase